MKQRKVPMRKCIACQQNEEKKRLFRIVRSPEGDVFLDPSGKKNGRGAYLSKDRECIEKARAKKLLDRSLNTTVGDDVYDEMLSLLDNESRADNGK
ncbi:RNase P modulator RnpM [Camelliibacillus cellulosilyticus]|uniref:RNase P modulator RnpM n=1 Tax=Camelliibacillus cellulosilyticus TaxID=2174486 RepID=A0ABV9GJV1_9BACL